MRSWALERLNWTRGEPATGKGAKGSYCVKDSYRQRSQGQLLSKRQLLNCGKLPMTSMQFIMASGSCRKVTDDVNAVYHGEWQL